jgi:polar amino acid transport system substrate-binding protein
MAIAIPKGREQGLPFVGAFAQEAQASGLVTQIQQQAGLRGVAKPKP